MWHFRINTVFQKLHPRNAQYIYSIEKKKWVKKTQFPHSLDSETKEVRKNTKCEALYLGVGSWEMLTFLYPDLHIIFLCQTGALNPIFHQGTICIRDTFLESCQEGVNNAGQECCFFPTRYSPEIQTQAWCWDCALDPCLNQKSPIFSLSLILPPSLSLEYSWTKFTRGYPGWNIWGRREVKGFTKHIPSVLQSSIKAVVQK